MAEIASDGVHMLPRMAERTEQGGLAMTLYTVELGYNVIKGT
jgi:hypothetical protein